MALQDSDDPLGLMPAGADAVNVGGTTMPTSWLSPDQLAQAAMAAQPPPVAQAPAPNQPMPGGWIDNLVSGGAPADPSQAMANQAPVNVGGKLGDLAPVSGVRSQFPAQTGGSTPAPVQAPVPPTPPNIGFGPQGATAAVPPGPAKPAPFVMPKGGVGGGGLNKELQTSAKLQEQAANVGQQMETQESAEQLAKGKQQSQQLGNQIQQQQLANAETQKNVQTTLAQTHQVTNDFLNSRVDPNRFWKNQSTGNKVLAALAQGIGGFAAGWTHTDNQVAKTYQNLVNQDIEAQKDAIQNKKEAAGMFGDLVKQYQAAGLSQQEAIEKASQTYKEKAAVDSANIALQHGGQAARQKWLQTTAGVHKELATTGADINAKIAAAREANEGASGKELQNAVERQTLEKYGLPNPQAGVLAPRQVFGANGEPGIAATPEHAKAFGDETKAPAQAISVLNEIQQMRRDGTWKNQAALQAVAGRLGQTMAEVGGEKESARTKEIIDQMIGDPASFFSGNRFGLSEGGEEARLGALRRDMQNQIGLSAKRHGVQGLPGPVTPSPVGAGG